jgi:dGTPase
MIEDVIVESEKRLAGLGARSAADIRNAADTVVMFSPAMVEADKGIKGFLYPRMYRHSRVMRVMGDAEGVIRDLFLHFTTTPADLPAEWSDGFAQLDEGARARRIADYIAGMTDRYALVEHARFFLTTPELR